MKRLLIAASALALVGAACSNDASSPTTTTGTTVAPQSSGLVRASGRPIPAAPDVPGGPLDPEVVSDLDSIFADLTLGTDVEAIRRLGGSGDPRVAWLVSDLLRFLRGGEVTAASVEAFEQLTGTAVDEASPWIQITDLLIAWDIPAPPGYLDWKRRPFEIIEPAWEPFFDDADAAVDWRHVTWGGVSIDDRPPNATDRPCPDGCIAALDHPWVTGPDEGDWYPDDRIVFGAVVNGEARAYPKNIMEVHEMVNDTLGDRSVGIPYCTLCGSAQGYFTDTVPEGFDTVDLRTSGLLTRSNKVMYDYNTFSLFDTFTGEAVSGPLQDSDFELDSFTIVSSTWGEWKAAHPDTTILAETAGFGRAYPLDPLRGRDDDGPIFPVGDVDERLPVQAQVVGVITDDGTALAFPAEEARRALQRGEDVELAPVRLQLEGDGLVAERLDGTPLTSHQAFWFAWSQFHPDTLLWAPLGGDGG